jgi:hypothetical protein
MAALGFARRRGLGRLIAGGLGASSQSPVQRKAPGLMFWPDFRAIIAKNWQVFESVLGDKTLFLRIFSTNLTNYRIHRSNAFRRRLMGASSSAQSTSSNDSLCGETATFLS